MAMKRVGVAELKDQLSRHLRAVEAGEELIVTDHDRPIARIVPVEETPRVTIRPARVPFADVRDSVRAPAGWPVDSLVLLLEERQGR
jgi:prevent-host-death family protein